MYYSKFEIIRKYSFFYVKIEIYQMPFSYEQREREKKINLDPLNLNEFFQNLCHFLKKTLYSKQMIRY